MVGSPEESLDEFEPSEPIAGIFQDLASADLEPPSWIVDNMLPPGLTFIAGPPKAARKSTISMALAALVSGRECNALPVFLRTVRKKGPVLVFSAEASAGELRHMLEFGLGVKMEPDETLLVADDPFRFRLDDPDGLEKMLFWLHERDPRLVILDPLADMHNADEKDAGAMIRVLRPLRQWGVEHDSGILAVHHTRKPAEGISTYDPLDMRGSSAIFGKADGCLMVSPRGQDLHVKAIFKRAAGWEKTISLAVWGRGTAEEKLDDIDLMILRAIAAGCRTLDTISSMLKIGKTTAFDRMKKLVLNQLVTPGAPIALTTRGKERLQ